MKGIQKWIIFGMTVLLMTNGGFYIALADGDGHKERKRYQKRYPTVLLVTQQQKKESMRMITSKYPVSPK